MKIAQISSLGTTTPPKGYGGTQRVVSLLSNELVSMNHEVTLYAKKGSYSKAEVIPYQKLSQIWFQLKEFDIIHNHIAIPQFTIPLTLFYHTVTTLHGWISDFRTVFTQLMIPRMVQPNFVVLNDSIVQRLKNMGLKNVWRVYNPVEFGSFSEEKKDYLFYIGRIERKKGIHKMVELAKLTKTRLILAGIIKDQDYFEKITTNSQNLVKFVGEINEKEKDKFMREAKCVLCMSEDEPFGLFVPEANSRGTPVLAPASGSMPELINNGYNGYLFYNLNEAKNLVRMINQIDPENCLHAAENFRPKKVATEYLEVYKKVLLKN